MLLPPLKLVAHGPPRLLRQLLADVRHQHVQRIRDSI